jgi:7-cyano-7-deazaguanine synthase
MKKILVVLSGGQDSTTCLFWAKELLGTDGELHAITFNYGQRHALEIKAAYRVAEMAGCTSHVVKKISRDVMESTSPLVSSNELERYENYQQMDKIIGNRTELTFVPMRNTLFLTIAANRAIALGCHDIVTGVCQEDNANYPDCRHSYVQAMQLAINESLGIRSFRIQTPLMFLSKAETVKLATRLPGCMPALAYSHTSYDGKYPPTDMNHANVLRAQGFLEANVPDPLVLRAVREGVMEMPNTPNYQLEGRKHS